MRQIDAGTGGAGSKQLAAGSETLIVTIDLPAAPCMLPAKKERYALFLFRV
jgi:hypothetical protein